LWAALVVMARKPFINVFVGHVKLRYARARARDLFS